MAEAVVAFKAALYSEHIPSTKEEALTCDHWQKAMNEEIEALNKNETWSKYVIPKGKIKLLGVNGYSLLNTEHMVQLTGIRIN